MRGQIPSGEARDGSHRFDVLTGKPARKQGEPLARFPYLPTYLRSWRTYYPRGKVLR